MFNDFMAAVYAHATKHVAEMERDAKGPDGLLPLNHAIARNFPGHHLGRTVYDAVRYEMDKDPAHLFAIAAWAYLLYKANHIDLR